MPKHRHGPEMPVGGVRGRSRPRGAACLSPSNFERKEESKSREAIEKDMTMVVLRKHYVQTERKEVRKELKHM